MSSEQRTANSELRAWNSALNSTFTSPELSSSFITPSSSLVARCSELVVRGAAQRESVEEHPQARTPPSAVPKGNNRIRLNRPRTIPSVRARAADRLPSPSGHKVVQPAPRSPAASAQHHQRRRGDDRRDFGSRTLGSARQRQRSGGYRDANTAIATIPLTALRDQKQAGRNATVPAVTPGDRDGDFDPGRARGEEV